MGRRSLAKKIFEEYLEEEPGEDTWLIIYDFPGMKPTSKFYDNLNRIKALAEDGQLVQYSVFMTRDQRAAKAMRDLVKHYDGQVMMFKGELAYL
jgi:hypothetical protein